jgi:ribose 5-phosphate isomerase B
MKIALGSDHKGYPYKEKVKRFLQEKGHQAMDFGTFSEESVDYPDFAIKAADAVSRGDAERGILFCWTGIGMCITANKVKGIRASLCLNEEMAMLTRQHNDSNVLALSAKFITEDELLKIVEIWLDTPFEGGRHQKRLDKIALEEDLSYYKQGLELSRKSNNKKGEYLSLTNIALIYSKKKELDSALVYFDDALKLAQDMDYKEGEADAWSNLGLIQTAMGDLDKALTSHQEALKIDIERNYREGEASDLNNIGLVYRAKGELDKALENYEQALKIDQDIGYLEGQGIQLNNIGLVLKDKGDLDVALARFQEALEIFKSIKLEKQIRMTEENIKMIEDLEKESREEEREKRKT